MIVTKKTVKKHLPRLLNRYRRRQEAIAKVRKFHPTDPRLPEHQLAAHKAKIKARVEEMQATMAEVDAVIAKAEAA